MPSYPKRYARKKYSRRKTYRSGGLTVRKAYQGAAWAAKQIWKLKGLVNSEMFKLDLNDFGTVITNAGSYCYHLTAVPIGDTDITRTGNSIFVRSINIRGQLIYNPTSGVTPTGCRIMVFMDTQQVGDTAPFIGSVIDATAGGVNAHMLSTTVGRFKVLYSRILYTDSINRTVIPINVNLPMRHHVRFNGSGANDIQKGGIWFVALSDQATNGPKLLWNSRTSFHDN